MKELLVIGIILASLLILLLAYAAIISTSRKKKNKLSPFLNYRYAHRGLFGNGAPENSLLAFSRAVDGAYAIELDVRLSRDGTLVVFHDDDLLRMTGAEGLVKDKTLSELSELRLNDTDEKIPTLDEVLSVVMGKVPLLVEIKEAQGSLDVTRKLVKRLKKYDGAYVIESFNPIALKEVRRLMPEAVVGILSEHFTKTPEFKKPLYYFLQSMLTNVLSRPDFLAYNHKHSTFFPFWLARLFGASAFAYTVKSAEDDAKALKKSFDTVIFEGYTPVSPYINDGDN